jgi:hypothetical protein
MGTEVLTRRFAAIGARVKVTGVPRRAGSRNRVHVAVSTDRHGEFFLLGSRGRDISFAVLDVDRYDRCLLLLVRGATRKFLCGFDERHWFVADVRSWNMNRVEDAKEALQPWQVRRAVARVRPKDRFKRRNTAYVRQGEWFFLPRWTLEVDPRNVVRDEPLRRVRGKAHVAEFVFLSEAGLYAAGSVRHPDHNTIVLHGWHQVLANMEWLAFGYHLGFLD